MMKLGKMGLLAMVVLIITTACGKTYTFEKIVKNNSDQAVTVVNKDYTSLQEPHVIQPRTTDTLVVCAWQTYGAKPSLKDVENRFQIISNKLITKKIENGHNWALFDQDNKVTCIFTINETDFVE